MEGRGKGGGREEGMEGRGEGMEGRGEGMEGRYGGGEEGRYLITRWMGRPSFTMPGQWERLLGEM